MRSKCSLLSQQINSHEIVQLRWMEHQGVCMWLRRTRYWLCRQEQDFQRTLRKVLWYEQVEKRRIVRKKLGGLYWVLCKYMGLTTTTLYKYHYYIDQGSFMRWYLTATFLLRCCDTVEGGNVWVRGMVLSKSDPTAKQPLFYTNSKSFSAIDCVLSQWFLFIFIYWLCMRTNIHSSADSLHLQCMFSIFLPFYFVLFIYLCMVFYTLSLAEYD